MSELATLRRRAEAAESELRARERAAALEKIEALAKAQRADDEKTKAAREAALADEISKARHASWVNHLIRTWPADTVVDPDVLTSRIPKTGWPEGDNPANYHFHGAPASGNYIDGDVATTTMGKLLGEIQERAARLKRAG